MQGNYVVLNVFVFIEPKGVKLSTAYGDKRMGMGAWLWKDIIT